MTGGAKGLFHLRTSRGHAFPTVVRNHQPGRAVRTAKVLAGSIARVE